MNHGGDMDLAIHLIDVASGAGADAVKFQTFKADTLVTTAAEKAAYQKRTTGSTETQFEMLRKLELPPESFSKLAAYCRERSIAFMSTPFDEESVEALDGLMSVIKIPSGELTNLPFIEFVAKRSLPVILSTGMSTMSEVQTAVNVIRQYNSSGLAVLHCVSNYPALPAETNLRCMEAIARACNAPVGLSDHSEGICIAVAAVALGACVIEKHFTTDRNLPGPDHRASLEPRELGALVEAIRTVEQALGDGIKGPTAAEIDTAAVVRRSLVSACPLKAGARVARGSIVIRRPGTGLPPAALDDIVGRVVRRDVPAGVLLNLDMFE